MHENLRITTILKVAVEKRPYWSWRVHPGDNPLNKKNLNRILNMNLYTCIPIYRRMVKGALAF